MESTDPRMSFRMASTGAADDEWAMSSSGGEAPIAQATDSEGSTDETGMGAGDPSKHCCVCAYQDPVQTPDDAAGCGQFGDEASCVAGSNDCVWRENPDIPSNALGCHNRFLADCWDRLAQWALPHSECDEIDRWAFPGDFDNTTDMEDELVALLPDDCTEVTVEVEHHSSGSQVSDPVCMAFACALTTQCDATVIDHGCSTFEDPQAAAAWAQGMMDLLAQGNLEVQLTVTGNQCLSGNGGETPLTYQITATEVVCTLPVCDDLDTGLEPPTGETGTCDADQINATVQCTHDGVDTERRCCCRLAAGAMTCDWEPTDTLDCIEDGPVEDDAPP